ncbi:MAG: ARMT1-like domain-containing protein [Candidatus Bathyarchaeota archaeon]|nr:ARMT1-like domain-containing protein [Candidatus Bathyarchaeota archaeon]
MKVEAECAVCLLHRGYMEALEATEDQALQWKAMAALTRLLNREFKPTAVPAILGTKRDRIIKDITGNSDPYAKKKQMSNRKAMAVLPVAKKLVEKEASMETRFRKACMCSIVGNIIEFDIPEHRFEFEDIEKLIQEAEEQLVIDQLSEIFKLAKKAKQILYLADNAGEIAFDTLLVHELKRLGPHVTVAVKGKPIINDATMQDAEYVKMHQIADDVITNGTDTVGIILEECSKHFLDLYGSADLVVAKGMGHAETVTELDLTRPHALLFRTKCNPVAKFFDTTKDKNVAKLLP